MVMLREEYFMKNMQKGLYEQINIKNVKPQMIPQAEIKHDERHQSFEDHIKFANKLSFVKRRVFGQVINIDTRKKDF